MGPSALHRPPEAGRGIRLIPRPRTAPSGLAGALLLAALAGADMAAAAETKFMGFAIEPAPGTYLVKTDANVRAEPETKSKRLGSVKKNERVEVAGKAKGAWMAVRKDGADLGFVYAPILIPLIDGKLAKPLTGKVLPGKGTRCTYTARFAAKTKVEGESFETSDYDVVFTCKRGGKELKVSAYMFIIEAPVRLAQDRDYQISVDVPQISSGDDVLSTVFLYRAAKNRVEFDGIVLEDQQKKPGEKGRSAKTVAEALRGAVEIAPKTWNDKAWDLLAGKGG